MALPAQDIQLVFTYYNEERYQDAKDLLDNLTELDVNNHHIYYFKAICAIHMNQLDDALINLGEIAYLNPDFTPAMHSLAYIFLRKGDFEMAMDKWIAIKTIAPKDSLANNILNKIKNKQLEKDPLNRYNLEDFIQLDMKELKKGLLFHINDSNEKQDLPPITTSTKTEKIAIEVSTKPVISQSIRKPNKKKKINFRVIIVLSTVGIFIYLLFSILFPSHKPFAIFNKMNNEPVLFSFQKEQLETKEKAIANLFKNKEKNYNATVLAINELYYSNAPQNLKDNLKKLKKSLEPPYNIKEVGTAVKVVDFSQNPILYQGIFVEHKGTVSNFIKQPQYITFNMTLPSGTVLSHIYFLENNIETLPFDNKDTVKIFGFIKLDDQQQLIIEDTSVELVKSAAL